MPVTMVTAAPPQSFSHKLRAALDARGMGAKTLARAIAREHGGTIESRRRPIVTWLHGATPVARNRELIEDVLGMERDALKGDEEDEESSMPSLDALLRAKVHELVEREMASR